MTTLNRAAGKNLDESPAIQTPQVVYRKPSGTDEANGAETTQTIEERKMKKKYRKSVEAGFKKLGCTVDRVVTGKHYKYFLTGPSGEKFVVTVSCTPKNEGNGVKNAVSTARRELAKFNN